MNLVYKDHFPDLFANQIIEVSDIPPLLKDNSLTLFHGLPIILDSIINSQSNNEIISQSSEFISFITNICDIHKTYPDSFFHFISEGEIPFKSTFILSHLIEFDHHLLLIPILNLTNQLLLLSLQTDNFILFNEFLRNELLTVIADLWHTLLSNESALLDNDTIDSFLKLFTNLSPFSIECRDFLFSLISTSIGFETFLLNSDYRLSICHFIHSLSKFPFMTLQINGIPFLFFLISIYLKNHNKFPSKSTFFLFKTFNNISENEFSFAIEHINKENIIDFTHLYHRFERDDDLLYEILCFMNRSIKFDMIDFESFYSEFVFSTLIPTSSYFSFVLLTDYVIYKQSSSIFDNDDKKVNFETIDCDYPILSNLRDGLINMSFDIKRKIVDLILTSLRFSSSSLIVVFGVVLLRNLTELLVINSTLIFLESDLDSNDVQFARNMVNIILTIFDHSEKNSSNEINFLEMFQLIFIDNNGPVLFEHLDYLEEIKLLQDKYFST